MPIDRPSGIQPHAGGGSHRSGGSGGTDGSPHPGAFKDGRSELAGRGGGHNPPRYAPMDGKRIGDPPAVEMLGGLAERGTRQIDIADEGTNRAHVAGGRDLAMRTSVKTGGLHPMAHAGMFGKGRW